MSDNLPSVWSAEPHTLAKHRIVQEYLAAWMPILSRQSAKISAATQPLKYIDAFAGPGIYENGKNGSPILALEVALKHAQAFPVPVDFVFIENDAERYRTLKQQVSLYKESIAQSGKIHLVECIHGDAQNELNKMLDAGSTSRQEFGPALVFLDQFGYSGVPMNLIARILSNKECEVLTFFFWRELDRFIGDRNKHDGITNAFGGTEWQPAINMDAEKRIQFMSDTYIAALKNRGGGQFVWPFAMFDESDRLLAWLFFCTNSIRGLEEMKKAMWKVDRTGGFSFSDKHGLGQLTLLSGYTKDNLAVDMKRGLMGKTLSVKQIRDWVLVETPAYLYKDALSILEKQQIASPVNPPKSRRIGQFPDDELLIKFGGTGIQASLFES